MEKKLEVALCSLLEAVIQVGVKYAPPTRGEIEEPPAKGRPKAESASQGSPDLASRLDALQEQNAHLQTQILAQQQAMQQQQQALMDLIALRHTPPRPESPVEAETEPPRKKLGVVS